MNCAHTKFRSNHTRFLEQQSVMPSSLHLWMTEVTSGVSCGLMMAGGGANQRGQNIPSTGNQITANGGAATLIKWSHWKTLSPFYTLTGMKLKHFAAGLNGDYRQKLNGNSPLLLTSEYFHGATNVLLHNVPIWPGMPWV